MCKLLAWWTLSFSPASRSLWWDVLVLLGEYQDSKCEKQKKESKCEVLSDPVVLLLCRLCIYFTRLATKCLKLLPWAGHYLRFHEHIHEQDRQNPWILKSWHSSEVGRKYISHQRHKWRFRRYGKVTWRWYLSRVRCGWLEWTSSARSWEDSVLGRD